MQSNDQKKVSIILLNYNGFEDSISCFESIQKMTYENYQIVIVDNASPDLSMVRFVTYMQDNHLEYIFFNSPDSAMDETSSNAQIILIQSDFNGGYGHGNNIGIKYALKNDADYVLVLNNDTVVEPDFLEPMVQMCENDKNIGILSGKIYFYDRPDTIWFNGGKFSPCTAKVEHFNFNEKDVGQIPQEPVTFISGCMWLIPKKVFNDVGFINEEYFMYMEDLEFCQRVLQRGYHLDISEDSCIFHNAGSSGGGHLSEFSVYWMARNKIKFISENISSLCKPSAYFYSTIVMLFRWIYKRRYKLFFTHIKGVIDGIK